MSMQQLARGSVRTVAEFDPTDPNSGTGDYDEEDDDPFSRAMKEREEAISFRLSNDNVEEMKDTTDDSAKDVEIE
jgi:hypothetical protein